jgi:hypothetical protein
MLEPAMAGVNVAAYFCRQQRLVRMHEGDELATAARLHASANRHPTDGMRIGHPASHPH